MKFKCVLYYLYLFFNFDSPSAYEKYFKYCNDLEQLVDIDFMTTEKIELIGEPD